MAYIFEQSKTIVSSSLKVQWSRLTKNEDRKIEELNTNWLLLDVIVKSWHQRCSNLPDQIKNKIQSKSAKDIFSKWSSKQSTSLFLKKILFYLRVINHTLPGKIAEKGLRGCHCDKQFVMSPLNRALEEIRLLGRIWILLLLRSYAPLLIVKCKSIKVMI